MKTRNHPLTGMMLALATLAGAATMSLAQVASSPEERLPYPSDYVAQQPEMPMPRLVEDQHEKCTTESCTRNDCRVLILPPLRRGELCSAGCEAPTECEVLRALGLAKDSKECACIEKSRDNVKVFREKIVDKVDAPRFFPLVGMAQLHHCSWQCTALFSETMQIDYPFLMKIKTQRSEVVYIDKDHLHLCTAAESAWAAKSEIALLPTDTIAFATIRVADMLDKLGINSQLDTMAPFSELKEKYAISFMNIERCTFALFDTKGSAGAAIIRLVDKPAHLKEFQAQLKKIFQAVQIIDDRTIIIGSNPAALQRCGQTDRKPCESELACARALEMADQHDFFAWGRLSALPPVDSFVLPSGIESGTVMIDLGDQITLDIRVACADEESTRWTQKALQTGLDLLRAQLLTANAVYRSADLIPGLADSNSVKEFQHLPVKTMRLAEKALQGADLINDGTEVHLSIALPMNTRMVRSEIAAVMRLMGDDKCDLPTFAENKQIGGKCTIGEAFYTAQENKQTAVAGNAAQTNATATATAFPCQGAWVAGAVCQSMDSRQAVYTMPTAVLAPASSAVPCSNASAGTVAQTSDWRKTKLSIANVRKDTALVFKLMADGKMEFVQKIAPGEAIDVQTDMSQRWIAIFADKAAGESFTPTQVQAESVWLLRAPAAKEQAPNPPDQGALTPRPPVPVQPTPYPQTAPLAPPVPPSYPVSPMPYGLNPVPMPYGLNPGNVPQMPLVPYTYPPQHLPAQPLPVQPLAPIPPQSNPVPTTPTVPQPSR